MTTRLSLVAGLVFLGACTSTSTDAILGGPKFMGLPDANYSIVGPVSGEATATTISPGIRSFFSLGLFKVPTSEDLAKEAAVGSAIFERDDVDLLIAPKSKVTTLDILGIYSCSTAHVKGQGVKLAQPRN